VSKITQATSDSDLARSHLVAVARALIPRSIDLTPSEQALVERSVPEVEAKYVAMTKRLIRDGGDPLGVALCMLRTADERRVMGAVYTPPAIVGSMVGWAAAQGNPARIVDPGAGSGRYILAAGRRFPKADLVAIDTDPFALLLLRAGAAVLGMSARLTIHCQDFRTVALPQVDGRTLYLGNPPYVRHHGIDAVAKDWFGRTAAGIGIKASKLAGLHIHFFLRTREIARAGDYGAYVTSSEWLDVNYGSCLREMLADGLGGVGIHLLAPDAMPFEATTTGAITTFHVGNRAEVLAMRTVPSTAALGDLEGGRMVPWAEAVAAPRWSMLAGAEQRIGLGSSELGEVFRVHRGQVTGSNGIWIAGAYGGRLPSSVLLPTVTKARELIAADGELTPEDVARLRMVIDIPVDLDDLDSRDRSLVDRFLAWAKRAGAMDGYVAAHRKAWWAVGLRAPAPILCTYMARRPPAFVLNPHGARHINISHGLYPREPMDRATLRAYVRLLNSSVVVGDGRTYAGGLTKFEPGEVERLRVPSPGEIAHGQT
jgi:predicted RNA methylase